MWSGTYENTEIFVTCALESPESPPYILYEEYIRSTITLGYMYMYMHFILSYASLSLSRSSIVESDRSWFKQSVCWSPLPRVMTKYRDASSIGWTPCSRSRSWSLRSHKPCKRLVFLESVHRNWTRNVKNVVDFSWHVAIYISKQVWLFLLVC